VSSPKFGIAAYSLQRIAWVLTLLGESHRLSAISFQPKQEAEGREPIACTLAQSYCNPL
jgi:hypothetical protein